MKPFTVEFKRGDRRYPLYIQLYEYIRSEIISGNIKEGAKLPALRRIAGDLNLSITTVEFAYNQLSVEGYIESKPQSGFYVAKIPGPVMINKVSSSSKTKSINLNKHNKNNKLAREESRENYITDLDAFDFKKWRKSMMRVIDDQKLLPWQSLCILEK